METAQKHSIYLASPLVSLEDKGGGDSRYFLKRLSNKIEVIKTAAAAAAATSFL
jgi:hypothetical protein